MNGHDRRKQQISQRITRNALDLFTRCGVAPVSMDEIAAQADVSKATIYKYFHSKTDLQKAVIDLYVEEVLAATEAMLDSDLSFMEKLKFTLTAKLNSSKVAGSQDLFNLLDKDGQFIESKQAGLNQRIKEIMHRFYEQGVEEGYIEQGVPFELFYLYSQVVEAGFKAKEADIKPVLEDPAAFDQLLSIYYFGMFRRV